MLIVWLTLIACVVLAFPGHPADVALTAFAVLPLEVPLVVAGALLARGARAAVPRLLVASVARVQIRRLKRCFPPSADSSIPTSLSASQDASGTASTARQSPP